MANKVGLYKDRYFVIKDKESPIVINHVVWMGKLHAICKRMNIRSFPIIFEFVKGKQYSAYYREDRYVLITLTGKEPLYQIYETVFHEFRHHMQNCNPILKKMFYNSDRKVLIRLLKKLDPELNLEELEDKYHDLLPEEIDAAIFGYEMTGAFVKLRRFLPYKGKVSFKISRKKEKCLRYLEV